MAGIRIGFDITTLDGRMPSPFSNLIVGGTNTFSHLIPIIDTQSLIARPQVIANFLDVIIYSHLHSDHFSLSYISILKATNPNIRIICPQNTKNYIKGISHFRKQIENNPIDKIRMFILNKLFEKYTVSVEQLNIDIDQITSEEQQKVINFIEEISTLSSIKIPGKESDIIVSAFSTVHPAFQMYIKAPFELNSPPGVLGYKITYKEFDRDNIVMFVGEGASDPDTLGEIFYERNRLKIIFFPITEQIDSKGSQFIQEFAAHSSIRTLAIVERLVTKGTKIVPLHQGLWYFQVAPTDIVKARKSLDKLGRNKFVHLPFVAISRVFKSINDQNNSSKTSDSKKVYVSRILATIRKRWTQYKRIARIIVKLPINGKVEGFQVGTVIQFSKNETPNIESPDISKETLQVLIQAFLTEYQILHQEIDRAWEWQTQLIYYALLIIGGVITLINVFPDIQLLFIGASFILTMIGWILIEKSIHMVRIGRYFLRDLIPRANQLLREFGED